VAQHSGARWGFERGWYCSTEVQLVCFGPCFLQGSQLFLAMPPQQLKIPGKYVSLYLSCLKEHIRVFIIIVRPKLQELCGVEAAPLCRQGPIHTSCTIVEAMCNPKCACLSALGLEPATQPTFPHLPLFLPIYYRPTRCLQVGVRNIDFIHSRYVGMLSWRSNAKFSQQSCPLSPQTPGALQTNSAGCPNHACSAQNYWVFTTHLCTSQIWWL
jgi:hypothetical protein